MKFFTLISFYGVLFLSGCATGAGDTDSVWFNENRTAIEEKADFDRCKNDVNGTTGFVECMTRKGYALVNRKEQLKKFEAEVNASKCPPYKGVCFGINWKTASIADVQDIDLAMRNSRGSKPLHYAASYSNAEVIRHLIKRGANINARGFEGGGPLHYAAVLGNTVAILPLIELGADVDYQDEAGHTPLMMAAYGGRSDFVQVLLEEGADPLIMDIYNKMAFDHAMEPEAKLKGTSGFWDLREATFNARSRLQAKRAVGSKDASLPPANEAENAFERGWRSVVVIKTATRQGSGVIIRPNMVATNCHVVDGASGIVVFKASARKAQTDTAHNADIYKADRKRDLCFLSVSRLWGVPAGIRQGGSLRVGEKVFAIGAPRGLEYSLSAGVVSQLRNGIIQTDTPISPGSSGGGLFDSNGNLVGITTSKLVTESIEGVSFAIPANWILENM